MTIPDVGRCLGTGKPPLEGSEKDEDGRPTGICATCSGRFELEDGLLSQHEAAQAQDRDATQARL
jgi:hypothetical protein